MMRSALCWIYPSEKIIGYQARKINKKEPEKGFLRKEGIKSWEGL